MDYLIYPFWLISRIAELSRKVLIANWVAFDLTAIGWTFDFDNTFIGCPVPAFMAANVLILVRNNGGASIGTDGCIGDVKVSTPIFSISRAAESIIQRDHVVKCEQRITSRTDAGFVNEMVSARSCGRGD